MFSAVKPLINRKFFRRLPNYFFMESFSFSCKKTTMKLSGPVNELFSEVFINLKNENPTLSKTES